ncbi:efflux RND transporter periplasmic adaptor subunit [Candidatus Uhrbacteria bacterium]|nr:MAG: efflux RND transporter periplasmic adaptor subunit [Candidatus Uhrbacteria bacterium]
MENTQEQTMVPKKSRFRFLKNKWFWIISIIVLGGAWFAFGRGGNEGPFYETRKVEKGNVVQTVEVTGEIKPDARLNLAFSSTAPFESIYKKVGSIVKRGDVIAELQSRDLRFASERARAALAIAQANLDARLAGETKETIAIAQAQVDQAKADLEATRLNVQNELRVSELALEKARVDFETSGNTSEQTVSASYANLRSALQGALGPMRSGLIDGDAEIGVDNTSANDLYEGVLGIYARDAFERAKQAYPIAKNAVNAVDTAARNLTSSTPNETVLAVGEQMQDALRKTQLYLDEVQKVLAGSITNINLSETSLASKKAGIDADRASVSTNLTSITNYIETARSSSISQSGSKETLQIAYDTAKANYDIAQKNLVTKVKTAETNLAIQQATLDLRQAAPRSVDVAGLRAQVLDAQTAYQQARERLADVQIIAPVDGVVTDIIPSIGEQVGANVTAVKMVSTEGYSVEALVPEADIVKVSPDQTVEITLDAFGDDVKFVGKVISENPDQTKVSDAIYYKVYVAIDAAGRDIKPGMTANLTVKTGNRENVLVIPTRSIRERDGQRYVRVIAGGSVKDADIELGLRGDEGRAEVVKGLSEEQIVVISEVSADEFGKLEAEAKVGN